MVKNIIILIIKLKNIFYKKQVKLAYFTCFSFK